MTAPAPMPALGPDLFALAGKVAIVTGAGGRPDGIGQTYARILAAFGASVVLADLDGAGAEAAAHALGGPAIGVQVDIADPASVTAMAARATEAFGGIDILVNNAALMVETLKLAASTIDIADWNRVFAVNLGGALLCAQAVIPSMRARGGGRIVNQLSSGAYPALSVYGVSKLALAGLTTTLAQELGRDGITVNAIAPGVTDSGAGLSMRANPSPYLKLIEQTCALRARGVPEELAGPLLLLCTEAGRWMTGQVLHVDGGVVLRP